MRKFNINRISEAGSLMVEAIAMLGLISMVTPVVYKKSAERMNELQDINAASQMRTLSSAMDAYLSDHYATLTSTKPEDAGVHSEQGEIDENDLISYLPEGMVADGKLYGVLGDDYKLSYVRKTATDSEGKIISDTLTGYVAANNEEGIDAKRASRIATMIGGNGGVVDINADNKAIVYGAQGVWEATADSIGGTAGFNDLTPNSIVAASSSTIGSGGQIDTDEFLHRREQSRSELNTMYTDLYMYDGKVANDIMGVGRLLIGTQKKSDSRTVNADVAELNSGANAQDYQGKKYSLYVGEYGNNGGSAYIKEAIKAAEERFDLRKGRLTFDPAGGGSFQIFGSEDGDNGNGNYLKYENGNNVMTMTEDYFKIAPYDNSDPVFFASYANGEGGGDTNRVLMRNPYSDGSRVEIKGDNGGEIRIESPKNNISIHQHAGQHRIDLDGEGISIDAKDDKIENSAREIWTRAKDEMRTDVGENGGSGEMITNVYSQNRNGKYEVNIKEGSNDQRARFLMNDEVASLSVKNVYGGSASDTEIRIDAADGDDEDNGITAVVRDSQADNRVLMKMQRDGTFDVKTHNDSHYATSRIKMDSDETAIFRYRDYPADNSSYQKYEDRGSASKIVMTDDGISIDGGRGASIGNNGVDYRTDGGGNVNIATYDGGRVKITSGNEEQITGGYYNWYPYDRTVKGTQKYYNQPIYIGSSNFAVDESYANVATSGANSYVRHYSDDYKKNQAFVNIRKGAIEVKSYGTGSWGNDPKNFADTGMGYVKADRFVVETAADSGLSRNPQDVYNNAELNNRYDSAAKKRTDVVYYDQYMVDPAYTSVMHDIKLTSRGGARLSDILPDFINKGIYVVDNSYDEGVDNDCFTIYGNAINKDKCNTSLKSAELVETDYASAYLGGIPAPQCPPGYAKVITLQPSGWTMGQVGTLVADVSGKTKGQGRAYIQPIDNISTLNMLGGEGAKTNTSQSSCDYILNPNYGQEGEDKYICKEGSSSSTVGTLQNAKSGSVQNYSSEASTITGTDAVTRVSGGNGSSVTAETGKFISQSDLVKFAGKIDRLVQSSTYMKSAIKVKYDDDENTSYGRGSSRTTLENDFVGWDTYMGFVYPASYWGKTALQALGFHTNQDNISFSNGVFWNLFPVDKYSMEGYATVYCYFDRKGLVAGGFDPSMVDTEYNQFDLNSHRNVIPGSSKKNDGYTKRLFNPKLRYNDEW